MGFNNTQIAKVCNLTEATIRNYRKEYKNDRGNDNQNDREKTRKQPKNRNSTDTEPRKTEPGAPDLAEDPITTEKTINFIGGKKHMNKKEPEDQEENECAECGTKLSGKPKFCPGCGIELVWGD